MFLDFLFTAGFCGFHFSVSNPSFQHEARQVSPRYSLFYLFFIFFIENMVSRRVFNSFFEFCVSVVIFCSFCPLKLEFGNKQVFDEAEQRDSVD